MFLNSFFQDNSHYKLHQDPFSFKKELNETIILINLYRGKLVALIAFLLCLLGVFIDIFINKSRWNLIPAYKNLYYLHITGMVLFTFLIILYYINDMKNLFLNKLLHYTFIFFALLSNEILSINAQFIHGQMSAYIIAMMFISSIFLLNKVEILIIIIVSFLTFNIGLVMIHINEVDLIGNISNTLTLSVCAFTISQLFFSMYVKNFLINKELESTLKMKDEFLSLMSHELKTPLTVINAATQAIDTLCKEEMSDRLKRYMKNIKQNSNRQLRLVNNILDVTRIYSGRIKIHKKNIDIVFLTKAIVESVTLYSEGKGINLYFSSSLNNKIIGLDEEKYERILLNLLSNSIKFTNQGKCINVGISSIEDRILLEVRDEGIGIPNDKINLIFERFGQVDSSLSRQAEGTGIGLSLVKLFVEVLGGTITIKSELGKGSVFSVLLPDIKVVEESVKKDFMDSSDNRIIQSVDIELSDIYL